MHSGFFAEPKSDDPTWARPREGWAGWLTRSTLPRARAFREFLNRNLAALPVSAAENLAVKMRTSNFAHAHFEMVVARTLQLLGATVEHAPILPDGRQPDWRGTFADGDVVVECTCPVYNADEEDQRRNLDPLAELVERLAPHDWSVGIDLLPDLRPDQSRKELRRFLEREMSLIPSASSASGPVVVDAFLEVGRVRLELMPKRFAHTKVVAGPATAHWGDDTAQRIREAYRAKRAQVRASNVPALLAVHGGPWAGLDAFDLALFGLGDRSDVDDEPAFVPHRQSPPTFAGVLAFARLEWTHGREPVLYMHPRFAGRLPASLKTVETRTLVGDRIEHRPAAGQPLLPRLGAGIDIP